MGKHLFHLANDITTFTNGSGDTTYDNVLVLCELCLAVVLGIVWSLAAERGISKRLDYRLHHEWLRLAVRTALGLEMLSYGIDKVIPVQFGELTQARLQATFGQTSPMLATHSSRFRHDPSSTAAGTWNESRRPSPGPWASGWAPVRVEEPLAA